MIRGLWDTFNEYCEPGSWVRTLTTTFVATSGLLFTVKTYLSRRRAICTNSILLTGKTCVVTGANVGIGKAVAEEFAKRGARVLIACRDVNRGNACAADIRRKVKDADVEVYHLDLSSFASVRSCAEAIEVKESRLDVLVNNAGLMACPFQLSKDGIEMQFAVNHLGHFLFTNLLLNKMKSTSQQHKDDAGGGDARIIVVSSALYKNATIDFENYNSEQLYKPTQAYGRSKLANLLFTRELSRRLPDGVTVNSMHPGVVWTSLGRYRLKNFIMRWLWAIPGYFLLRSAEEGAQTIVHMATDPHLRGVSGKYFGDCKVESVRPNAQDGNVASMLWEMSEKLTGFRFAT